MLGIRWPGTGNKFSSAVFLSTVLWVLVGCIPTGADVRPASAQKPLSSKPDMSFVGQDNSCTVLMGGGGTIFNDEKAHQLWFTVNKRMSDSLVSTLQNLDYQVESIITPQTDTKTREQQLLAMMIRNRCNRAIQVTHRLYGDEDDNGVADNLEFKTDVFALVKKSDAINEPVYSFAEEFSRKLTFPLTSETMETLVPSELGVQMGNEIAFANVINRKPASQ